MKLSLRYTICAVVIFCLTWLISACDKASPSLAPTITPLPSPTALNTQVPTTSPSATPSLPMIVLLAPDGADQALADQLQADLNDIANRAGMRLQIRGQLPGSDLNASLKLVVALPPDPGLGQLASSAPETQFLAVGIPGLEPRPNLTVIRSQDNHPDQQGFIAGVISAMLSADWRVGVISLSDTAAGKAARTGFLNGVKFYCGLCRPAHPPFYEYPLYSELPATATSAEWQEAANYMVDHDVVTVYVAQGVDQGVLTILDNAGIQIITNSTPPEAAYSNIAVLLTNDSLPLIKSQVEGLLDGSLPGGALVDVPIQFAQVDQALFTLGKQRLAEQILSDLQAGYIDTGVDLTTGENRP